MFDAKKFLNTELEVRTKEIKVPELQEWFGDDDPIWVVRGLSHKQLAIAEESASSNDVDILVKALSGDNSDKLTAIKELVGITEGVPKDTIKRMEFLVVGSVEPKIDLQMSVKISNTFPMVFVSLTNNILELTGLGAMSKVKQSASGRE